jgi:hypothetical protein
MPIFSVCSAKDVGLLGSGVMMGPLLLYALLPGIFRQACPQLHTLANVAQVQSFLTMIMMEAEGSMDT